MRRVGMLTSGGDCQALSTTMKGVAKSLYNMFDDMGITGLEDRYKGLMYVDYQIMKSSDFPGILTQGGAILGTSRQLFELTRTPDENGLDKVGAMKHTYRGLKPSCLITLDGNDSQKTASMLNEEGLSVVSLPRTVDNDLWGTDMTFGFQNVVDVATNAIDCIHTTAVSHGRMFIVEVMGRKADWLTLYAGLTGRADAILLPEMPYNINIVCNALTKRSRADKRFSIPATAGGAISGEDAKMSKKELEEEKRSGAVYPSTAYEIEAKIQEVIGNEIRVTVPGHMWRGDEPCFYDHVLATRLDAAVAKLATQEQYGYMVAVKNNGITQVPFSEVAGGLKTVNPECSMIEEAKMVGISFGDE